MIIYLWLGGTSGTKISWYNCSNFLVTPQRIEINTEKSCGYWFDKYTNKPEWLVGYNWRWVEEGDLSKILGTLFGLNPQHL